MEGRKRKTQRKRRDSSASVQVEPLGAGPDGPEAQSGGFWLGAYTLRSR